MTDDDIGRYLEQHNYEVLGVDYITDIATKTGNIAYEIFDYHTMRMTIITITGGYFQFKWKLRHIGGNKND